MGILSTYMTHLTLAQRALYDRLRAQGMDDLVARNIAIAVERNNGPLQKSKGLSMANRAMQAARLRKGGPGSGPQKGGDSQPVAGRTLESAGLAGSHLIAGAAKGDEDGKMNPHEHLERSRAAAQAGDEALNAGKLKEAERHYNESSEHSFAGRRKIPNMHGTGARSKMDEAQKAAHASDKAKSEAHASGQISAHKAGDAALSWLHFLGAGAHAQAQGFAKELSRTKIPDIRLVKSLVREAMAKSSLGRKREQIAKMDPQPSEFRTDGFGTGKKTKRKAKNVPKDSKAVPFSFSSKIVKAMEQPWQRIVHSVVYVPDTFDLQGDRMDAETIEKAAHEAMRSGIYINHEHGADAVGAHVVESYIAPCDMNLGGPDGQDTVVKKGTWVMGLKVTDDDIWQGVVDGTYCGFSLEGVGVPTILDLPENDLESTFI